MRFCVCAAVACLLGIGALGGSAAARPPGARAKAVAKKHDAKARALFRQGRFEEAAQEYEQANRAVARPEFLHNIARCHQRLEGAEHARRALFYFDSYLKAEPDAPNRAAIEAAMVELRARLERLKATTTPPPTPTPAPKPTPRPAVEPPPAPAPAPAPKPTRRAVQPAALQTHAAPDPPDSQPTPVYKRWWLWTLIGVAVAGAATAAVVVTTRPGEAAPLMGTMPPGQVQLELRGRR